MTMNFPRLGRLGGRDDGRHGPGRRTGDRGVARLDDAAARSRLGLTFMAGRNDTGPVTTLADASVLAQYAAGGGVGSIAFWSLSRDNGGCPDVAAAQPTCSGIAQDDYAFARAVTRRLTPPAPHARNLP